MLQFIKKNKTNFYIGAYFWINGVDTETFS